MFMFRGHCGAESSVLEGRLIAVEAKKVKLNVNESNKAALLVTRLIDVLQKKTTPSAAQFK